MMWVCRAGKDAVFMEYYLHTNRIYLPWDGFNEDLRQFKKREAMKQLVVSEKGSVAKTSITNWAGQLCAFCYEMKIGDYVLIPHYRSRTYSLATIKGDYEYDATNERGLWHSREVAMVCERIPKEIFRQSVQYSLGAYRTVFKVKDEDAILDTVRRYEEEKTEA